MKPVFTPLAAGALLLAACTTEAAPDNPRLTHAPEVLTLNVNGDDRKVLIEEPLTPVEGPVPLVLIFHGGGGSADRMQAVSQSLSRQLRARGYMVAYLNGTARRKTKNLRTWNAKHCCAYAAKENIDDAAFVNAFLTELQRYTEIDRDRISLLGHSNGGMLSYRIAPRLNFTPAGMVIISGAMFSDQPALPDETSVLAIHTRDDETLSFSGDDDRSDRFRTQPILAFESVGQKLMADQSCTAPTTASPSPGTLITQALCANGSTVALLVADQGGHKWPKDILGLDLEAAIISFLDTATLARP